MRRLEKILLAGTLLAIPMLPPFSGVATSQSVVTNSQSLQNDVTSDQTLNVVDTSGAVSSVATSTGNNLLAATVNGSLDVESMQTMPGNVTGNVSAVSHTFITTNAGDVTSLAAATGNTAEGDSDGSQGGGPLTGNFTQSAAASWNVKSETDFQAPLAQASSASVSSQAIANSLGFNVTDTSSNVTTNQTNSALIDAEGGSEVGGGSGATLQFTGGTAAFSTTAVGNNLTATGTGDASQTIDATQLANGPLVQAAGFVNVGNGQTVEGDATATANNLAVTNTEGPLVVTNNQTNDTNFTFADSVASDFQFGTGQATAFGVGNSALAGNQGPSTDLNNVQVNNGGIQAVASFTGDNGFDATSSATAMGNAAIGFACSQCGGVINIANNQTTTGGGVEADSTINITNINGNNRSTTGIATAVGNNATFYVSKPTN
jgi:hypothetical protein